MDYESNPAVGRERVTGSGCLPFFSYLGGARSTTPEVVWPPPAVAVQFIGLPWTEGEKAAGGVNKITERKER